MMHRPLYCFALVVLSAGCEPTGEPPIDCPAPMPAECGPMLGGTLPIEAVADTLDGEDRFAGPSCATRAGSRVPDAAFQFMAPASGVYTFSTEGSAFDTVLSVRSGGCLGEEIACNDDSPDGSSSSLTLELEACEAVLVIVDGHRQDDSGLVRLTISQAPVVCEHGTADDGTCLDPPPLVDPSEPAQRSAEGVCTAWREGQAQNATRPWTAGADACDPGTLSAEGVADSVRRVNIYRWLAGLDPVAHDDSAHDELMECAHLMSTRGELSHDPPSDWQCWTAGGASAAARSNLSLGTEGLGAGIAALMGDVGVMSLGHRRWILGPRLGAVEVGYSSVGRPAQCLGVFDESGSTERRWSAFPNPGPAPIEVLEDSFGRLVTWSFHAYGFALSADARAEVVDAESGEAREVESYALTDGVAGYPSAVGFTPVGWTPSEGATYRVTIRNSGDGDISYETTLVSCP